MAAVVNGKTTLFCGGLSPEVDAACLDQVFIPFGDIVKIQLPLDSESQVHKGYCFVEYEDLHDCAAAIENMNGAELFGKILRVQLARPGKYQEITSRAVWDEEAFIKDKTKELENKLTAEKQIELEKIESQPKKKVKTSFKDLNQNPKVYMDVSIESLPLGRITFELFADTVPKTAEK